MLTFRNTVLVFILLMLGLAGYDIQHELSIWFYIVPILILVALISRGCYFIQSGFFLKTFFHGDQSRNEIAITFDDGPHDQTMSLLAILKKYNVNAAFFCIGKNISGRENIIRKISEEGHVVGNHSFSHSNMIDFYPVNKLDEDVSKTDDLLFKILGKKNNLFRPPYGVTTPNIARLVKKKNYKVIGWSVRSYDTTIKDHDRLMNRILSRIRNGSVILLHDSTPGIETVVEEILEFARKKNLKVVSIREMFNLKENEIG